VTRSGDVSSISSVTIATANGTALASSDYVGIPTTVLAFAPGETTKIVTVTIIGDSVIEGPETFQLNLIAASGALISDASGVGTIIDDDG
jgi:chitinase